MVMTLNLKESYDAYIKDIENLLGRKLTKSEYDVISRAYDVAKYAHYGFYRKSGEPFFTHPVEVSKILAGLHVDVVSIVAGLLHDTVEDSEGKVTLEDIKREFGEEVARIVDGVTKVSRLNAPVNGSKAREKLETIQKMLFAMAEDIRVIFVKLADRLHNMRTINFVDDEQKKRYKAKETLEIYAPIAHKLGIHTIKAELEDLSFKVLYPDEYYRLKYLVSEKKKEREERTKEYIEILNNAFEKQGISAKVEGRFKHYYSIWRKMKEKGKKFNEIYDLIAVRAIVNNVKECYTALGTVHSLWKPLPGRFKDYIAAPKSNGYRSLHTTVITHYGEPLEVQIRDHKMHTEAEYGLIAHWIYKEKIEVSTMQKWIKMLLEWKKEVSEGLLGVSDLKKELVLDEVFVFTPKGEIKHLPKGATPIDFAYAIHTEIGHHYAGAKVNGRMVPIDYELQNGDVVEIIVNRNSKGPSLDWIRYAKSPRTRAKIRKFFKEKYTEEMSRKGLDVLRGISKRLGRSVDEILKDEKIIRYLESQGISEKEFLVRIGDGSLSKKRILSLLGVVSEKKKKYHKKKKGLKGPLVIVEGLGGLSVHIAKCCNPIPGDRILAVVSKRGLSIHRVGCKNVKNIDSDRIFHAEWAEDVSGYFSTKILVEIEKKTDIGTVIEEIESHNAVIESVGMFETPWKTTNAILSVKISDKSHLTIVLTELKKLKKVLSVGRVMK